MNKLITREIFVVETDESYVFLRSVLGSKQAVTVRFSIPPEMDEVKMLIKLLNLSGDASFGKADWKKAFPEKRKPRSENP